MSIRQHGGRAALLCGLLLLLTGGAAVSAATTDSPVVITGVVPDGDRLEVTLFNGAPCAESIGEWQLSTGSTRTALPKGLILGGFARVTVPVHLPPPDGKVEILRLSMPDGKDVQVLEDPVHTWMPGDIFSLHGVDRYRYIIVYSQVSDDERVYGCYEVDQAADGGWFVSQFIHGQEVFSEAFMEREGARFLGAVRLDDVVVTDTTPGNDGQTYYGRTLGSLFGGGAGPAPWTTPEPTVSPEPTAPLWPVLTPTRTPSATLTSTPTGVPPATSVPATSVPVTPAPTSPLPSASIEPTAPTAEPTPSLTTVPSYPVTIEQTPTTETFGRFGSRRVAGWAGHGWYRQPVTVTTPVAEPTSPVPERTRSDGGFYRSYPSWTRWNR